MSRRLQRIARMAREFIEADRYAREVSFLEATDARETPSARLAPLRVEAARVREHLAEMLDIGPSTPALPPLHLQMIRHALGHDPVLPRSGGDRNGYSSEPTTALRALGVAGLMERCGERGWRVTEAGARAAGPSTLAAYRRWERNK